MSGGETQRINLTACLGAGLTETLFALDEPTIGLHHQDVKRLIKILRDLADGGNFVCVVEHDDQVIRAADRVIEIGPEPGLNGGYITFNGTVPQLLRSQKSETGKWLSGKTTNKLLSFQNSSLPKSKFLKVRKANIHNFKNFSADLPLGSFTAVAGLSGSGKSTLVHDIIYQELSQGSANGWVKTEEDFCDVVMIDQASVPRFSRSNPVLYSDAWGPIKEAFGRTPAAKLSGFSASDFSFNAGLGRCESCLGLGYENVEMQFLPDISIPCPLCEGKRFKGELLEIKLDGLNVAETLDLTISAALQKFAHLPKTFKKLGFLAELGLGYLKLGQPLGTLSGGEAQRLKLAKYMIPHHKNSKPAILFLDEPTTGLHLSDVQCLINCLRKVTSGGHSLFVIEHNASLLAQSDWIVELGPGAGKKRQENYCSRFSSFLHLFRYSNWQASEKPFEESCCSSIRYSKRKPGSKIGVKKRNLKIVGAWENNLKGVNLSVPSNQFVVITGPSGSGKSSLAFDVIFAEGQRRFLESMSSYARQFVEQIGKP